MGNSCDMICTVSGRESSYKVSRTISPRQFAACFLRSVREIGALRGGMSTLDGAVVFAMLLCTSIWVSGEKWRFVLKRMYECDPEANLLIGWHDVRVSFLQKGDVFRLESVITIARDTNITSIVTELYKDGVVPVKFLTFRNKKPCKTIAERDSYMSPMFDEGGLPRTCYQSQGRYPVSMVFDMHGDLPGSTFRSSYAFVIKFFEDETLTFCTRGNGIFKKNGN